MRIFLFFAFLYFFCQHNLLAQTDLKAAVSQEKQSFATLIQFLSSADMEGRETGTTGSEKAAKHLASMMQKAGLKPYQKISDTSSYEDYYQAFQVIRYTIQNTSIALNTTNSEGSLSLSLGQDLTVENIFRSVSSCQEIVFVGYGINKPELKYNSYAKCKVRNKVVIIMDGYPNQNDTLTLPGKALQKLADADGFDMEARYKEAYKQGASAVVVIHKDYLESGKNSSFISESDTTIFQLCQDAEYTLLEDSIEPSIPCFILGLEGSRKFCNFLNLKIYHDELDFSNKLKSKQPLSKSSIILNVKVKPDTLIVHNVIGKIKGVDSTKTLIIGAHYDHLGKRGETIYNGADDNASGASGLIALADIWSKRQTPPRYNLLFVSWTAEEKGLLGSRYFANHLNGEGSNITLYVNMDMISRSVSEDSSARMLSIGTRIQDTFLRDLALKNNSALESPFLLDLWDVTGHSGSDYASFTEKNIPIMTYNSGLHNDYHTSHDRYENIDLTKMSKVLLLINTCISSILEDN